jgi:decaprenylphospho-beta-D-erythro-pentofuranosid-2-ulose 2-reductase
MNNVARDAQTVLVLGGTSAIGRAIADALVTGPGTIVLAGRDDTALASAAAGLARPGRRIETVHYDATAPAQATVSLLADLGDRIGDLDAVVVAVGALTGQSLLDADTVATAASLHTNLLGPAVAVHAAALRLRAQGHGTVIVLSSVAAVRPRRALLTYGAAKAGLDTYARGIGEMLHGTGARVLVVRPGHVRSRMTAGLPEPPFTTDPRQVASAVRAAVRNGARVTYVPAVLAPVMTVLRLLPAAVFRRVTASRHRDPKEQEHDLLSGHQ